MKSVFSKRAYWIGSFMKWLWIRAIHVTTGKYHSRGGKYGGNRLYSEKEGMDIVSQKILDKKPFAMVRESFVEWSVLVNEQTRRLFGIDLNKHYKASKEIRELLKGQNGDGQSQFRRFLDLYERSVDAADIIGVWDNLMMGDAYVRECVDHENKSIVPAGTVGPYNASNGWSKVLKGKKVLVVSPFTDEIRQQYARRGLIWADQDILPEFELITVKAVWYYSAYRDDRFDTWFEALDYMFDEIMKNDFDIALLGCGMFATPLCMRIKGAGKQAIQMSSSLQKWFGIRGKRWDDAGDKSYNEYWIRPKNELGEEAIKVLDDGGYW